MGEEILAGIVGVLVLGVLAQWISWRLRIPSILLLLLFGFLAGPISGFVNPDELLGDILFPIISLSVAIILFEGGLSLKFFQTPDARNVTFRLISVGLAVTWFVGAIAAYALLGLDLELSVLLGAVLTVSGPTVVLPLLRSVRPKGIVGEVLKWEGILIDPAGALVSVLVFEAILARDLQDAPFAILSGVAQTVVIGTLFGVLGALLIVFLFRRHLLPDYLQNPFTLTVVVSVLVLSNHFYPESGLLAVTLMAILLANTKGITIRHVLDFKEDLTNLIVSSLFIILAARMPVEGLLSLDWKASIGFLVVLIVLARPLSVFLSTAGAGLTTEERLFICAVAPRGIVAAAVASVFAFELTRVGHPGAEQIVSYTFLVIIGTVVIYGLGARPVAQMLRVGDADSQGVLIVGANELARQLGEVLRKHEVPVVLVDSNVVNVRFAQNAGLRAYVGNILSEGLLDQINISGIGRLVAMTPNDEVNALAALRFEEVFERSNVYQLPSLGAGADGENSGTPRHLRGRFLFGRDITYRHLEGMSQSGGGFCAIEIPGGEQGGEVKSGVKDLLLFGVISDPGKLEISAVDNPLSPRPGDTAVVLSPGKGEN